MINIDKVKTICSYLAENVDNLYVTKLMKLFYYIDFVSYAERGSSVTNDIYYKLPYGPVPTMIKNEIDNLAMPDLIDYNSEQQLSESISLEEKEINGRKCYLIKNINKDYNLDNLSEFEQGLLKKISGKFKSVTGKTLTNKSHKEAPYLFTSDNSEIDYELSKKLDLSWMLD